MAKSSGKKANYFVGLDVSEFSVKVAVIEEQGGKLTLLRTALFEHPSKKVDPTQAQAISQFLSGLSVGPFRFYSAVFGSNVVVRRLNLPKMSEEELLGAAKWAARDVSPFPVEGAKVDCLILGEIQERGLPKLDAMVMVASQEVMASTQSFFSSAGISLEGVVVSPFAVWPFAEKLSKEAVDEVIAFVDLGEQETHIHIFKKGELQFTRDLSLGGRDLTEAVTQAILPGQNKLISLEEAEEVKQAHGIPSFDSTEVTEKGVSLRKVSEMMRPVLERMAGEILRSLDYFKEQFREGTIHRVYLLGGGSLLKGMDTFLARDFGIPVERFAPQKILEVEGDLNLSRFVIAIGLALDHASRMNFLRKPKPRFALASLLKDRFKRVQLPTVNIRYIVIFLVCLFLMIVGTTVRLYQVANKLEKEVKEKQLILDDVRMLMERRIVLEKLRSEKPKVQELLSTVSQFLVDPMVISELSFDHTSSGVKLSGLAQNEKEISDFFQSLSHSALFESVTLKELKKEGKLEKLPFSFQFQMVVKKS